MAMYNQCPHFDEGILPMCRKRHAYCVARTSAFLVISLLVILPRTSLGAAPKYETAYACEGKTLTIECEPGDLISLIRANYGRFSITICNDHGNVEWSVNCMSPKSLRVLHSKCAHKQNCSVLASTNMFGDPCPGTHKYLEAHYQCISAAQTSTTTNRPSPPWLITSQPNIWSTSTIRTVTTARIGSIHEMVIPQTIPKPSSVGGGSVGGSNSNSASGSSSTEIHLAGRPPSVDHSQKATTWSSGAENVSGGNNFGGGKVYRPTTPSSSSGRLGVLQSNRGLNGSLEVDIKGSKGTNNGTGKGQSPSNAGNSGLQTTLSPSSHSHTNTVSAIFKPTDRQLGDNNSVNNYQGNQIQTTQSSVNSNNYDAADSSYYCGPTTARNLFWNITRVGEVNVQPCPGGATGIAKWRCVLVQRNRNQEGNNVDSGNSRGDCDKYCDTSRKGNDGAGGLQPSWYPATPDLTQCRSLWLNNLEIRVNQRDSSLISIANDLSQVTSSKTLYGGDMLVTTKIIQTMSEKMTYDIVTFPDQRQREAIIYELLHGVVKTGSNLLDASQQLSWLDLSFEDQMRVATSLLTGLEDNAFLLADTIIRERNVVQKVKNILLSVRVLETRNIIANEVFPDAKLEQWQVSDDQIELPRGALIENSEGGLVRIVFVAFDRLESILKPSYDNLDIKFSTNYIQKPILNQTISPQRIRVLNSKVISASLGKGRHIQLSQPIRLVLRHLKTENVTNPTCVFWNYIDHAWSEDGCYLESTNRTHTICMCNHLTNFAILMDIVDEHNASLLSMFDSNMRILIYISIAICILFIVIAILTLKLFNGVFVKVRTNNRNDSASSTPNNSLDNSGGNNGANNPAGVLQMVSTQNILSIRHQNINNCPNSNFVNFKNTNINSIVFATSSVDTIAHGGTQVATIKPNIAYD